MAVGLDLKYIFPLEEFKITARGEMWKTEEWDLTEMKFYLWTLLVSGRGTGRYLNVPTRGGGGCVRGLVTSHAEIRRTWQCLTGSVFWRNTMSSPASEGVWPSSLKIAVWAWRAGSVWSRSAAVCWRQNDVAGPARDRGTTSWETTASSSHNPSHYITLLVININNY